MRGVYSKRPRTIRLTAIQEAALYSSRYAGLISVIVRFFIDKLINGDLPVELKQELDERIAEQSQQKEAA